MDEELLFKQAAILDAAKLVETIIRKYIANSDNSITEPDIITGVVASLPITVLRRGLDFEPFNGTVKNHDYLFTVAAEGYCWGNHIKHSNLPVDLDNKIPLLDEGEILRVRYRPRFHEEQKSTGVAQSISGDFMKIYNGDPHMHMGSILFDYEKFIRNPNLDLFKCLDNGRVGQLVGRVNLLNQIFQNNRGKHQKPYSTITDIASELQRRT
jgi:hypothetical protein